ncbi:uncharacterized protein J3D65DRAFT_623213 [Phyllosticta citribraziliensis]|uniref:Uncharacterized protein n=1 Tax=Phyllosticta citribraziliensis TaxID=989973 RepID=A0ABR1LUG0_9PEZI
MDERLRNDASPRSGSISGLTSLEDDTDEFGRMLVQAARDEQRIKNAMRGGIQPFRKARTRPRVALTLENLERNIHQELVSDPYARDSPDSLNSGGALDPPVQPPREWGRKAKHDTKWLRRINDPDEESEPLGDNDGATRLGRAEHALDITPRKQTNMHFPSVEGSPDTLRHIIQETPSSTRRYKSIQDWDLTEDLTSGSLLASTPAIPRNTRLHDIRQLEIESITEPNVEPPNLDRLWQTSPKEAKRKRKGAASKDNVDPPRRLLQERSESDRNLPQERASKPKLSAEPIGQEHASDQPPIIVYKSPPDEKQSRSTKEPARVETTTARPGKRRYDSHELLRKLAREMSNSPSPGREAEESVQSRRQSEMPKESPLVEKRLSIPNQDKKGKARAMDAKGLPTPSPELDDHNAQVTKLDTKSESRRTGPAKAKRPADIPESTSNTQEETAPAKTPVMAGARVDTPATVAARQNDTIAVDATLSRSRSTSRLRTSKQDAHEKDAASREPTTKRTFNPPKKPERQINNSKLPKSALSAVIGRAKATEEGYGDSTLDSLQGIMSADNTVDLDMEENTLEELSMPSEKPKTAAERERQQELLQLQNMNERLRATRKSIRDANRNMRHLENKVEAGGETPAAEAQAQHEAAAPVRGQDKSCDCGGSEGQCYAYQHPFLTIWRAFKSLFWDERRYLRLTWFGLFFVLFWSWFWTETILCNKYCHKYYAEHMEGYGVNPNAPRIPYVTLEVASWVPPFKWLKPGVLWMAATVGPALKGLLRLVYDPEAAREQAFRENLRFHFRQAAWKTAHTTAQQRVEL